MTQQSADRQERLNSASTESGLVMNMNEIIFHVLSNFHRLLPKWSTEISMG